MPEIVKIQFQPAGKLYDFASGGLDLVPGDKVIVETERGRSIGIVVGGPQQLPGDPPPEGLKKVVRKALIDDFASQARHAGREQAAFEFCQARIRERNLEMKLVRVEYLFDGSKAIFYFTADGRIDFRDLVKDLAHQFHTRIEMRQIGVRDEAKMVGGIGVCGRELCCSTFLRDFAPVSVKMAKEQSLALNPVKISGQCGRLLCCLGYEYDAYCSLKKGLPKCGKRVSCQGGCGEVVKQNVLQQSVTIRNDEGRYVVIPAEQIRPEDVQDRQPKPPQSAAPGPEGREQRERQGGQGRPPREQRKAPQPAAATTAPAAAAAGEEQEGKTQQQPAGQREGRRRSRRRRSKGNREGAPQGAPDKEKP